MQWPGTESTLRSSSSIKTKKPHTLPWLLLLYALILKTGKNTVEPDMNARYQGELVYMYRFVCGVFEDTEDTHTQRHLAHYLYFTLSLATHFVSHLHFHWLFFSISDCIAGFLTLHWVNGGSDATLSSRFILQLKVKHLKADSFVLRPSHCCWQVNCLCLSEGTSLTAVHHRF